MAVFVDRAGARRLVDLAICATGDAGDLVNCLLLIMVDVLVVAAAVNADLVNVSNMVCRARAQRWMKLEAYANDGVGGLVNFLCLAAADMETVANAVNAN